MEATTLIFMSILAMLLVGLLAFFIGDMSTSYPSSELNSTDLQVYQNFSSQLNNMAFVANESTTATFALTPQDNSIFAGFGYLWSAFNGAIKLFSIIPDWINNTLNILVSMAGLPTFAGAGINNLLLSTSAIIISLIVLLGMLYYWLKVK